MYRLNKLPIYYLLKTVAAQWDDTTFSQAESFLFHSVYNNLCLPVHENHKNVQGYNPTTTTSFSNLLLLLFWCIPEEDVVVVGFQPLTCLLI